MSYSNNGNIEFECPVLGLLVPLSEEKLPTIREVVCYTEYLWRQEKRKGPIVSTKTILDQVISKIRFIWGTTSIPIISDFGMEKLLLKYHKKLVLLKNRHAAKCSYSKKISGPSKKLKNSKTSDTSSSKLESDIEEFNRAMRNLFDVCTCKCPNLDECSCLDLTRKVPLIYHNFLSDQRSQRNFFIPVVNNNENENENNNIMDIVEKEDVFLELTPPLQTRLKLPNFAMACDRCGVPDRGAAYLASSLLLDVKTQVNIPVPQECLVIDKRKVQRERKKIRIAVSEQFNWTDEPWGLYFDGRKDQTLVLGRNKNSGTSHRRIIVEEHYSLLVEPQNYYLDYISPTAGGAQSICDTILKKLYELKCPLNSLQVAGSDGTNVNIGSSGGIIHFLEEHLKRPLHWFICLLHLIELPLKGIIKKLYGPPDGPTKFCGSISPSLDHCEILDVEEFPKIECDIPDFIDSDNLSTDQEYFWKLAIAVSTGKCPASLAARKPGPMTLSRWLNTAARFLRLWISTVTPDKKLKQMVEFIMKVYFPTWFRIKRFHKCINGPQNLYHCIQLTRCLDAEMKKIVHKKIQHNGFFAHSENILLAMLADEDRDVRERAVNKILEVRERSLTDTNSEVRSFKIPKINFDCTNYIDMIDWSEGVTEPPLTKSFPIDELKKFIEEYDDKTIIFQYPCHTQAVERCVKLVTEVSKKVCSEEEKRGYIRTVLMSRKLCQKYDNKAHFLQSQPNFEEYMDLRINQNAVKKLQ